LLGLALLCVYLGLRTILMRAAEERRAVAMAFTLALFATVPLFVGSLFVGQLLLALAFLVPALLRARAKLYAPVVSAPFPGDRRNNRPLRRAARAGSSAPSDRAERAMGPRNRTGSGDPRSMLIAP
jgi:hypothetical protein